MFLIPAVYGASLFGVDIRYFRPNGTGAQVIYLQYTHVSDAVVYTAILILCLLVTCLLCAFYYTRTVFSLVRQTRRVRFVTVYVRWYT